MKTLFLILFVALNCFASIPIGSPLAQKGGTLRIGYSAYPKHLLHYFSLDEFSRGINGLIFESLLETSPVTGKLIPRLAATWEISKDGKHFTFHLRPEAKFSDGKSVTATDVKFTFDAVTNPKQHTIPFQSYFSSIESCRVINPLTVEFTARTGHFKNLEKVATFFVLPAHVYATKDFDRAFDKDLVGSGPYVLRSAERGDRVLLTRNRAFWGNSLFQNQHRYNFDELMFKVIPDSAVHYEAFKRGNIDYYYFLSSRQWYEETNSPLFQKGLVKKLEAANQFPRGFTAIYWNQRNPLFQNRGVRLALGHLFPRQKIIDDLFFSSYRPTKGLVGNHSDVQYDPAAAKTLLTQAGWSIEEGALKKAGKKFEFEYLNDDPRAERHLTLYQEALKSVGIQMHIRTADWATVRKLVDDRQFDATDQYLTRDTDPSDFARQWGSKEAAQNTSSNITGFSDPIVDKLAAKIDATFDDVARGKLIERLDKRICDAHPLTFGWEPPSFRIAYWDKFGFEGKGFLPYENWNELFQYWWYDPQKKSSLL